MRREGLVAGTVLMLCCSAGGCQNSSESMLSPSSAQGLDLLDIATSMVAGSGQGVRMAGAAPGSNGGPNLSASANQTVVNGGTLSVAITASAPFTTIYMFVAGKILGISGENVGGIGGYYEVRLPTAESSDTLLLTFPQTIPLGQFDLMFAVANASGVVGPYVSLTTTVTSVGTGDVQVTLSWDADSDVDLHVVDPAGEEIYYGHPNAASGGTLDLDSNAACALDHVRNENITWPVGRGPRGHYTVRVDYWDNCGVAQTNYTVRINDGGTPQIVTGSFTGAGDQGGLGSGRTVASFDRQTGPALPAAVALPGRTSVDSIKTRKAAGGR